MKKSTLMILILAFGVFACPRVAASEETVVAFINANVIPMDKERVLAESDRDCSKRGDCRDWRCQTCESSEGSAAD